MFDKALPNDETKLRSLISNLKQHGQIRRVIDQPATIGALPVAVASPGKRLVADIIRALTEQSVVVPGTNAAVVVLPHLALQIITLRKQRDEMALEVKQRVLAHPLYPILTSMPGVGIRTAVRLLTESTCRAFAAYLAACAGLAPVTRRSGSSIRGGHPSRRGNKTLKRALFLSAFAAEIRSPGLTPHAT